MQYPCIELQVVTARGFYRQKELGMRRFVVKFKVGGADPWRTSTIEKTVVEARNVAMAMQEFQRKHAPASEKMTVTEVYEEV